MRVWNLLLVVGCLVALSFAQAHKRPGMDDDDSYEKHRMGGRSRSSESHEMRGDSSSEEDDEKRRPKVDPFSKHWLHPFWMPSFNKECDNYEEMLHCMPCVAGHKTREDGCAICECRDDPCKTTTCKDGEFCHTRPCLEHPCENPIAECIRNTICDDERVRRKDMVDMMSMHKVDQLKKDMLHLPECTEKGKFQPLQCQVLKGQKQCWCVTPYAEEIEGTRVHVYDEDDVPDCIAQKTTAVVITFSMAHEYENVDEHLGGIRDSLHQQLPMMLVIEARHVLSVQVASDGQGHIVVTLLLKAQDDDTDLTEPVHQLGKKIRDKACSFDYKGKKLTAMPHTLKMKHEDKGEREETWKEWGTRKCRAYFRRHPKLTIGIAVGAGLLLVALVTSCCCLVCRKRQLAKAQFAPKKLDEDKSQKYKENIAYSHSISMNDEKKVPLA